MGVLVGMWAQGGAGVIECDVTFTKDKALVCRHAQNDHATSTNILATPLASKCVQPFQPATFDAAGGLLTPARAECRTSELTVAEFKSLRGKMDSFDPRALTAEAFMTSTGRPGFQPTACGRSPSTRPMSYIGSNRPPDFGRQAVYFDDAETINDLPRAGELSQYKSEGIQIVAPPLFALLAVDGVSDRHIQASRGSAYSGHLSR